MTLLTIAQGLARDVGLAIPSQVIGSPERTWKEAAKFASMTGEELARRVDWGVLTATATLTGDGTALAHSLPAGFGRIAQGAAVFSGTGIVRPLTQAEWATLPAMEGTPRYFILRENVLRLWPYLADSETVSVAYQGDLWCDNGTAEFASDDDAPLMDEELFLKGLIVRWRRQKGMEYADYEAEYESSLQDFARFDDRSRL